MTRGCRYELALVPFGKVVMAKIADADKMRVGKLDSAWVKTVWVVRVDKSNEHLLLTTKGCMRSKVVRRIPDGNQASYHAEAECRGTFKGSAEMLRNATVRPGEPPGTSRGRSRKDGVSSTSEENDDVRTRSNRLRMAPPNAHKIPESESQTTFVHQRTPTASPTDTLPHQDFGPYKQSKGMISQQGRIRFFID